jgi:hypothetical protein
VVIERILDPILGTLLGGECYEVRLLRLPNLNYRKCLMVVISRDAKEEVSFVETDDQARQILEGRIPVHDLDDALRLARAFAAVRRYELVLAHPEVPPEPTGAYGDGALYSLRVSKVVTKFFVNCVFHTEPNDRCERYTIEMGSSGTIEILQKEFVAQVDLDMT